MNVTYDHSYVSKNGNDVFVYTVDCTPEELKAYKKAQGKNYRHQDNVPVWFTTRYIGESGRILISSAGKVVADMSEFRKQASLAKQFGGNLGDQIAALGAAKLMGLGTSSTSSQSASTPSVAPENPGQL